MAVQTNYEYDEIVGCAKLLLNSYDPDEVFGVLRDLSDVTAGLNLSSSDVTMMISGLSRMRTTGKAAQEYLNYFRERGVGTPEELADQLWAIIVRKLEREQTVAAPKEKDAGVSGVRSGFLFRSRGGRDRSSVPGCALGTDGCSEGGKQ